MLFCEGLRFQRRTVWTSTGPELGLRAGRDQVGLFSLMSKVQLPAWSMVRSIDRVQSIVLVFLLVLLGSLVSVEGILMEDQEELLVELHNRYRGVVQPSASAMLPLKWDGNLKLVAEGYAAKCIWTHNPELEDTGENLFVGTGDLDLERAMEKWFLERLDYNYDNNSCDEDKMCGHYTQMVWADTHRVGCAVHLCAQMELLDWTEPAHFLVCNYYPPGNYEGERPYVEGEWCSQCPENLQRCENNLCAPEETTEAESIEEPTEAESIEEPTEAESIEEPTEGELAPDTVTPSLSFQDLHTTPGTEQVPLPEQDQHPAQNPDQELEETVEQEAVVPPPATESIPQEPLNTAGLGTEQTETVSESVPESAPKSVPESVTESGSKTKLGIRPEPEAALQPKPDTPTDDPIGGPAGGAVIRTEQEQKIPPIGEKAPPTHHLTPPPENRGQKQKDVVEKHTRVETSDSSVVLSGSWSLVFLWIYLLCL